MSDIYAENHQNDPDEKPAVSDVARTIRECRYNAADPRGNPYWPTETFERAADFLDRQRAAIKALVEAIEKLRDALGLEADSAAIAALTRAKELSDG